jgi:hypothetical protein
MLIWGIRLFLFFVIFNAALDILLRLAGLVEVNMVSIADFFETDMDFKDTPLFEGYPYARRSDPWVHVIDAYRNASEELYGGRETAWVVCHLDGGLCNRMLHSASCFIFAIHHHLALALWWKPMQDGYNPITNEWNHIDAYDDIFQRPPGLEQALLLPQAPSASGAFPACAQDSLASDSMALNFNDPSARVKMLDAAWRVPRGVRCLHVEVGWNMWGAQLVKSAQSSLSSTPFRGVDLDTSFAYLARYLFQPKYQISTAYLEDSFEAGKPIQCEWLLQHRYRWGADRPTPSPQQLQGCGFIHGLTPRLHNATYFVSDFDRRFLPDPAMKPSPVKYCRHRPHCDVDTVHLMYMLGGACKSAVLTEMSIFGDCIAGLGPISRQWKANAFGRCRRKAELYPSENAGDYVHDRVR